MKDQQSDHQPQNLSALNETSISSQCVFDGKLLQVCLDHVRLPDGKTSTREWIKHPGACAVVPVFDDGSIMLLKQYRFPVREVFIEVPAGKIDSGEQPDQTAERELKEESGLQCAHLQRAGSFYPAIGYADEIIHVYVAWGLTQLAQTTDEDEFLIPYRIPFAQAIHMIESGDIKDGKTISSLIQARAWWKKHQPFMVHFS